MVFGKKNRISCRLENLTFHILILLKLRFWQPIKWEKKYWFTKGKNMKSELYINKAFMQLKKGDIDGAVCSMKKVIETNDDIVSLVQAHCLLAEYYFIHQNYACSKEHIDWIMERQDELENEYDDLLNDEIINTNVLAELIDKYLLV